MNISLQPPRFTAIIGIALLFQAEAWAAGNGGSITIASRESLTVAQLLESGQPLPPQTHALSLTVAYFPAAGWQRETVIAAARKGSAILAQCGVRLTALELVALDGTRFFQTFQTTRARELAHRLPLRRPTIYFVADTLQRPAFDAEAIGHGNSRTRPELAHTVWITRGARDLDLVVAHEVTHVLMDSGEHSEVPGNLMRDETRPENVNLDESQCARLRRSGAAYGLLFPQS